MGVGSSRPRILVPGNVASAGGKTSGPSPWPPRCSRWLRLPARESSVLPLTGSTS